jgi:hypothetical protein
MMTTPETDSACHVIHVRVWKLVRGERCLVSCSTIGEAALEDLRGIVRRERRPELVARDIRAAAARHGVRCLAILYTEAVRHELEVPVPFHSPFPPAPLDETYPTVREICAATWDRAGTPRATPVVSIRRRIVAKCAEPILGLLVLLMVLGIWVTPIGLLASVAIFLVWALVKLGSWWRGLAWFLVPGGVACRKKREVRGQTPVELYTPADSLLTIQPLAGGWLAHITRGTQTVSRNFTGVEAVALLAVWQSRRPPPRREELSDLAGR